MEEVSRTNYETCLSLKSCENAKPDYNTALNNGSTWLMSFRRCCMRMKINPDATIQPVEMKKESVKIIGALDLFEYSPNKMIISDSDEIHLVNNWRVIKTIDDPDRNSSKFSLTPFPGFDDEKFPFIVVSGLKYFSIVNVQTGHTDVLIEAVRSTNKW